MFLQVHVCILVYAMDWTNKNETDEKSSIKKPASWNVKVFT